MQLSFRSSSASIGLKTSSPIGRVARYTPSSTYVLNPDILQNLFDKPNEQSQACLDSAMARPSLRRKGNPNRPTMGRVHPLKRPCLARGPKDWLRGVWACGVGERADAREVRCPQRTSMFVFKVFRHSGYFPWNHGKFICKGEGKWSCPGLRSYRSYGSEVTG